MDTATSLYLQGLSWGLGVGAVALGVCVAWGAYVKSVCSV